MLTKQDKIWLLQKYPGLVVDTNDKQLSGEVEFTGTYNEQSGRFLQIEKDTNDGVGGLRLSGQFKITIKTRADFRDSKLPALSLEGFNHIPGRHFNQSDFSGCICNPLEEDEFLEPRFEFQRYFKELVAPFLYGQLFFTQEDRWPWFEYAHGGLGLLEAFSKNPTLEKAEECIKKNLGNYIFGARSNHFCYKNLISRAIHCALVQNMTKYDVATHLLLRDYVY